MIFCHHELQAWFVQLRSMDRPELVVAHLARGLNTLLSGAPVGIFRSGSALGSSVEVASAGKLLGAADLTTLKFRIGECDYEVRVGVALKAENQVDVQTMTAMASDRVNLIQRDIRLASLERNESVTGLLHGRTWSVEVESEIQRARRILRPVSVVLLRIWPEGKRSSPINRDGMSSIESNRMMRIVGRAVERRSRAHDRLGRLGPSTLGLLLPHTPHLGAVVKAERVRRMIEGADFSRVFEGTSRLHVAAGVAEYPSVCRDAEELIELAQRALETSELTPNFAVGLVEAEQGFVSDFILQP